MKGAKSAIERQREKEEANPEGFQVSVPRGETDGTNTRRARAAASGCLIPAIIATTLLLIAIAILALVL